MQNPVSLSQSLREKPPDSFVFFHSRVSYFKGRWFPKPEKNSAAFYGFFSPMWKAPCVSAQGPHPRQSAVDGRCRGAHTWSQPQTPRLSCPENSNTRCFPSHAPALRSTVWRRSARQGSAPHRPALLLLARGSADPRGRDEPKPPPGNLVEAPRVADEQWSEEACMHVFIK